ncbi:MAG: nitrate reductase molybdenum cofactor assembly chaperone NarJ/NarW [Actinomycetota bacterium]|nr:nitrate reductase molybdenum cofactor assembly chaperone NarJ/NarW [Actinomycetota bacterium]
MIFGTRASSAKSSKSSKSQSRSRQQQDLTQEQLVLAWQSASLLLGYPDEELLSRIGLLRDVAANLPAVIADPMTTFLTHLEATPLPELAADFVRTFDHQRRCCLYLTYFEHGDTRNRGVALLRFKTAYREAGMILSDGELPDHLGVLLEFGATADVAMARTLLLQHRAGLELLRLALQDAQSPWACVLQAITATLPPLAGDDREAVMKLAAQGPPAEEVGLAPFAPPEALFPNDRPETGSRVSLPLPTFSPANRGAKG